MSEHDRICELLSLAAAGALERSEEERLLSHIRSCDACSREIESWNSIAASLRRLPTPQPSAVLIQRTRLLAEARLEEQSEARWQRTMMIFVVTFAWMLTIASWPLVHLLTGRLVDFFDPNLNRSWLSFAGLTTIVWLTGGIAAVLLAWQQRRERRLA